MQSILTNKEKKVCECELNEEKKEACIKEETQTDEKELIIKSLEEKIINLENEIEAIKKAAADIVNRNKQMEIDRKYASVDLIKKLLVPLSYFEGALKLKTDDEAFNNFLKGFEMIYNLIFDTLKSDGLREIVTNINTPFDPRIHEVTELVEVEDGDKDMVLEVIQKGYLYKDRVIKPTQVKVSTLKKDNIEDSQNIDSEEQENNVN